MPQGSGTWRENAAQGAVPVQFQAGGVAVGLAPAGRKRRPSHRCGIWNGNNRASALIKQANCAGQLIAAGWRQRRGEGRSHDVFGPWEAQPAPAFPVAPRNMRTGTGRDG